MKKRNVKRDDSPSVQKPPKLQQKKKEKTSTSWKKIILLSLAAVVMLGFSVIILPELIQQVVFMYRLRLPYFTDLSQPADFSLNHTVNMYLSTEEGISLGVWHTVPDSQWKEAQGKDLNWYQKSLGDGNPVFIYLQANRNNRAAPHRIGVSKVLSALGYHVVVPEYRDLTCNLAWWCILLVFMEINKFNAILWNISSSWRQAGFGDATGEPTEDGLTTDALYVYNWVKARSGSSLVVVWGHSIGTAISTNVAVKLLEKGVVLDGVILEGAPNSAPDKTPFNPLFWFYFTLPGIKYLFIGEGSIFQCPVFPIEENVKKMKSPILFLYSEDDHIANKSSEKLFEIATSAQNKDRVKMVKFDASKGYKHNGLYRDAELPGVIKDFVKSL